MVHVPSVPDETVPATSALANIAIVLVRPESPGNIGAAARIVRNFGFGGLRVVRDEARPLEEDAEARKLAHRSVDVLRRAEQYRELAATLADREWAVGTSGRAGRRRGQPTSVRSIAARLVWRAAAQPGAIVFGPESYGLSLADLAHCDEVVRIPQCANGPSLNLAQAIAVVASEVFQASLVPSGAIPPEVAGWAATHRLSRRMNRVARHCGLALRNRPEELAEEIRRILTGRAFSPYEIAVVERWLAQIEWFVGLDHALPETDG